MSNKHTDNGTVSGIEAFLNTIPSDKAIFTKVKPGTKAGTRTNWNDPENLLTPYDAGQWIQRGGNIGIILGLDLGDGTKFAVLDVEDKGVLPDKVNELVKEHTLMKWKSPHGGLNRLLTVTSEAYALMEPVHQQKLDLDDDGNHELEVLTKLHALVPPSEINHQECRDGKTGCPGTGQSRYRQIDTNPDSVPMTEDTAHSMLDRLGLEPKKTRNVPSMDFSDFELPEIEDELADEGEAALQTLQARSTPAFKSLVGLLQGGTGGYDDIISGDSGIDRSLQELTALTRLHETIVYLADEEEDRAKAITHSTFKRYIREHPKTSDGQVRRWLKDQRKYYRKDRLGRAVEACDRGKFERFLHRDPRTNEWNGWTGDYSYITRCLVRFALDLLTGELEDIYNDAEDLREFAALFYFLDLDRDRLERILNNHSYTPPSPVQDTTRGASGYVSAEDLPKKIEVAEVAQTLDRSHNELITYETMLQELRREGMATMACIKEGRDYRYYPHDLPNPPNAEYVLTNGEKYTPEVSESGRGRSSLSRSERSV